MPVVWCIGQRGTAFLQEVRRASRLRRAFSWGSLLLTARPGGEIRTPNLRLMFDVTRFRASAWRTKGTGEIRSRAESQANKFSPARMLLFGPNSAPNSGRISLIQS